MVFLDRVEAGQRLNERVNQLVKEERRDVNNLFIVLALPRGGVPVGAEVARGLGVPLDVFVVRKLGAPGHEELAMGAIASGGVRLLNDEVIRALKITSTQVEEAVESEMKELERREEVYRGDRPPLDIRDRSIILVDDGLATGYSMRASVAAIRRLHPHWILVAVPVAARSTCEELRHEADAVLCLHTPIEFTAVGQWYRNFTQTSDDEVRALLDQAAPPCANSHQIK